ncbi:MAG: GntP family permease [Traorella sp.]
MNYIEFVGLLIAIILLAFLVYKNVNMLLSAIICSLIAGLLNGLGFWETMSCFSTGFTDFFKTVMLLFIFSTVYANVMSASGSTTRIAYFFIHLLGKDKAILIIGIATGLLVYGGINVFVVGFTILPIALILLKEADISKVLLPAIITWGQATFATAALPGTPQVNNVLPTAYLGTTTMAGPLLGIIATIILFLIGWLYLEYANKKLKKQGLHFEQGDVHYEVPDINDCPTTFLSFLPIIVLMVTFLMLENGILGIKMSTFDAINTGMLLSISLVFIINWKKRYELVKAMNKGLVDWINPIITVCSIIAFGAVIKATHGFSSLTELVLGLDISVYISVWLSTNILAGVTGSASGGIGIAVDTMAAKWIAMGGVPEAIHRIASVSSVGLDSLPHSGGLNIMFNICGEKLSDGLPTNQ